MTDVDLECHGHGSWRIDSIDSVQYSLREQVITLYQTHFTVILFEQEKTTNVVGCVT